MMIETKRPVRSAEVSIPFERRSLPGGLTIPPGADGLVLFAHGSGSSRYSPRNQFVARGLEHAGIATLLIDLLTLDEERSEAGTGHLRFDIEMLAGRLNAALRWLRENSDTRTLRIGFFGASTGAAAALVAAAQSPQLVKAVVSRGGRPDLAGAALARVQAPTLLIVGGDDRLVLDLNRVALSALQCEKRLEIIAGATQFFEEPGALEEVTRLASDWFTQKLLHPQEAGNP